MHRDELERLLREDLASSQDEASPGTGKDGDVSGASDQRPLRKRLADALNRLRPPPPEVPGALDEAILAMGRVRLRRRRLVPILAVAAGVLLAVTATFFLREDSVVAQPRPLDIVDAYRLALRLDRNETPESRWDVNDDGRVDEADVAILARRAVALPGAGDKK